MSVAVTSGIVREGTLRRIPGGDGARGRHAFPAAAKPVYPSVQLRPTRAASTFVKPRPVA